jgi:hypothetical protein
MESLHSSTETKEEKTDEPYLPELMHARYTSTLNQKKKVEEKTKRGGGRSVVFHRAGLSTCALLMNLATLAAVSPCVEARTSTSCSQARHEITHEKKKSGPGATWSDRYSLCACESLGRKTVM